LWEWDDNPTTDIGSAAWVVFLEHENEAYADFYVADSAVEDGTAPGPFYSGFLIDNRWNIINSRSSQSLFQQLFSEKDDLETPANTDAVNIMEELELITDTEKLREEAELFRSELDALLDLQITAQMEEIDISERIDLLEKTLDDVNLDPELEDELTKELENARDNGKGLKVVFELISEAINDVNNNFQEAAKRLHLHPNTIRYRIDKIQKMLDCDIKIFDNQVNLILAYKINKFILDEL